MIENYCNSFCLELPELERGLNPGYLLWLQDKTLTSARHSLVQDLHTLELELLEKNHCNVSNMSELTGHLLLGQTGFESCLLSICLSLRLINYVSILLTVGH